MKNYELYLKTINKYERDLTTYWHVVKHLESQVNYWKEIAATEKEKNMKLEDILKKLEEKIYGINKEGK